MLGWLKVLGGKVTERSIANKMSRGTFSIVFFLQCINAISITSDSLDIAADDARRRTLTNRLAIAEVESSSVADDNCLRRPIS